MLKLKLSLKDQALLFLSLHKEQEDSFLFVELKNKPKKLKEPFLNPLEKEPGLFQLLLQSLVQSLVKFQKFLQEEPKRKHISV